MALGSLVVFIGEVLTSNPRILFGRYLWIDELQTKLIASEPSVWQSLIALKHSPDPTPPVYHLLARASWGLLGGDAETAFRALSFVSMWVAVVLVYVLLRRTFDVVPALVAVLAFWSSIPIIDYTFYGRPYASLLAAIAGFCLTYGQNKRGPAATALTAALAALVCTLHYFGVFALGAVVLSDAVARREPLPAMTRRWLPAAAGPIALACCWPFIHALRTGETVFTYLPAETFGSAVRDVFLSWGGAFAATALLVFAWFLSAVAQLAIHLLGSHPEARRANIGSLQPVAGLLGLLLVPIFVAVFSALAYPAMATRYMIPGLLGVTAVLAVVASNTSPRILVGTAMSLMLIGTTNLRQYSHMRLRWQTSQDQMIKMGQNDQLAIVTFFYHQAYVLYDYAPALRSRVFIADFRGTHMARLSRTALLDYQVETKWLTVHPDLPKLVNLNQLRRMGRFHLVDSEAPILEEQEDRPEITLTLQEIAQIFSLQNAGDFYEVRPN
jgi:Dolichyl-phosphate-mannose-protein mannosyltransferase